MPQDNSFRNYLKRLHWEDRALICVAFLIGLLSPILPEQYAALWGLVPLLAVEAQCRSTSFLVSLFFYLGLSRGIVPGAYVFFRDGSLIRALVLWVSSAIGLALPYAILYPAPSSSKLSRAVRLVLVVLASAVPPLGLIGWGSPLVAAGLFFPAMGWIGLGFLLVLYGFAATWRRFRLVLFFVALALTTILPVVDVAPPANWIGINTEFGRLASGSADFDEQYQREREVFAELLRKRRNGEFSSADVVLMPETLAGRLHPTTWKRWRDFFANLDQCKIFIVGGEIPKGRKYNNVMVAMNDPGGQTAIQRWPVPFSMYRPLSEWGANADIFSLGANSVMVFSGQRTGFLICYEQFLTWPFLTLMTFNPEIIAAPSNFWWCRNTTLPAVRNHTLQLLSALFNIPIISAVNI